MVRLLPKAAAFPAAALLLVAAAAGAAAATDGRYASSVGPAPDLPNSTGSDDGDGLMQVMDSVFTDELVAALIAEAPALAELGVAGGGGTLKNSKRVTFWQPCCDFGEGGRGDRKPRFAAEQAVRALAGQVWAHRGGEASAPVEGGKYWLQYRGGNEDVGFHYDKDEGLASDHMTMRFPDVVCVVYLSNRGAATLVLNQTVTQNGNVEIPAVPTSSWMVFPKVNKMMVQRGDLNHGAPAWLASDPLEPGEKRITLIVSWETFKPLEPNCHDLLDSELPTADLSMLGSAGSGSWGLSPDRARVPFETPPGGLRGELERVAMGRAGRGLHAAMPHLETLGSGGSYHVRWGTNESLGQVSTVEWHDPGIMREMLEMGAPAVIVFADAGAGAFRTAERALLEVATAWRSDPEAPPMHFYIAASETPGTAATLEAFGIPSHRVEGSSLAVLHHTQTDVKYVMRQRAPGAVRGPEWMSREHLEQFVTRAFHHKLRPVGKRRGGL